MPVGTAPEEYVESNGTVAWEGAPDTIKERGIAVGLVASRENV
jgi:hypothetical protein